MYCAYFSLSIHTRFIIKIVYFFSWVGFGLENYHCRSLIHKGKPRGFAPGFLLFILLF